METFNPSLTIPFPYTYGITNVTNFTHPFPPPTTTFPPPIIPSPAPPILTTWMDTRIWSRLPQQLLDRILAFLPMPAFFRARSVCKRWYALLYSNSFLQLYLQVSPRHHCFIFFTHKTPNTTTVYSNNHPSHGGGENQGVGPSTRAFFFDPYEVKWYTLTFSLIPLGFSPSTSSGGLVCWVSDHPGLKTIFLHNPLVGSVTQLPTTHRARLFPSVGLTLTSSSIDLILAGDDLISPYAVKNLTSESFHLDSGGFYSMWDTTSPLPRLCSLESGQMAHFNGKFYCMNHSPFSVLAHDIASNTWWKIQAPMRRFLRSPCLVECKDRLVLVAGVEKSKLNVPRSLRMWVLQGCGTQWVEMERMPQQLYAEFEAVEGGRGFDCVGSGEFIVMIIKGNNVSNKKGLLFDFERKRWVWMPCCPSNVGDLHGFAYEPTLTVPVTSLVQQLALPFQSFTG